MFIATHTEPGWGRNTEMKQKGSMEVEKEITWTVYVLRKDLPVGGREGKRKRTERQKLQYLLFFQRERKKRKLSSD